MYKATPTQESTAKLSSQLDAVNGSMTEQIERRKTTRDLITRVTRIADKSSYSLIDGPLRGVDPGYSSKDAKYSLRETTAPTQVYPLPTDESSPAMGAQAIAYRHSIHKDGEWRKSDTRGIVTSADINVGVISDTRKMVRTLVAAQTTLRVTMHPPQVYYDNGESGLRPIEPSTEDWTSAEGLVSTIEEQISDTPLNTRVYRPAAIL